MTATMVPVRRQPWWRRATRARAAPARASRMSATTTRTPRRGMRKSRWLTAVLLVRPSERPPRGDGRDGRPPAEEERRSGEERPLAEGGPEAVAERGRREHPDDARERVRKLAAGDHHAAEDQQDHPDEVGDGEDGLGAQ